MRRLLTMYKFDQNDISNVDETHFVINVDNGRTLGFYDMEEMKHAEVVSGGEWFTMVVRLSGEREARIEFPFTVFKKN